MTNGDSIHSPTYRKKARHTASYQFLGNAESRAIGVVLILFAVANYVQTNHEMQQGQHRSNQIAALATALASEQDSTKNRGENPVAPPPAAIVKDPQMIPIPGPAGPKGDKGAQGNPGATGAPGKPGANGRDGTNGVSPTLPPPDSLKGDKGDKGDPGTNGLNGKDGTNGKDGKDGSPPTDITITIDGTTYVCTPVTAGSTSFQCNPQPTNTPSPQANQRG